MRAIFLLVFLPVSITFAQTAAPSGLSLAQAIYEAKKNNPELNKLRAQAEKTAWTKLEALSSYLPRVSVGYDHFISSEYMRENIVFGGAVINFPAGYPQDNITLDATLTVFDGLEGLHKFRAASLNAEAADLEVTRAKFQIEETVRSAFFRTLAAQKLVDVAHENIKTLQEHLEKAHLTEKAGFGTRFEVLRIEATLEEARAELEQADARYHDSWSDLNEVMGLEGESEAPLEGELPVLTESDVPASLSLSPIDREDLTAQRKREEAAHEMRSASYGFWFPSISLFAEEQYYKFGDFDAAIQANSSLQNASMFGVHLKWNLFDGGYSYAKQREASEAALEASAETRKALTRLPHEFESWKRNYFHSVSLYKARSRALLQYQESVRLAVIGVKAGSRTHTEMLDAELDLFRARAGLVKAQADAVEALGKLELAVGHKIWKGRD